MTTSVKKVVFNLQNMDNSFVNSTSSNYDDNNYDDNNYDENYAKVTQHKSISHGSDFNRYQMGLKNKTIEGFNGQNDVSQSVLLKTQMSSEQQQDFDKLKQEYALTQVQYNSLINTISPTTSTSDNLRQLALLETKLDLLTQQINTLNDTLNQNFTNVNDQISTNSIAREKYMNDITSNNETEANISNNIHNMLNDSDIVTLQQNYSYILFSIIAAASVLVAMNVFKNN